MKIMRTVLILLIITAWSNSGKGQDLLDLFNDEPAKEYVTSTFKTSRLINGQSVKGPAKGELLFIISHRFGLLNTGIYEFFGLDQAYMRIGLDYGLSDKATIGWGRSIYLKTYDVFIKYKIVGQSTGTKSFPLTISYFGSVAMSTLKWEEPARDNLFSSRLAYVNELLIARKFSDVLSVQLMPGVVHRNLVATKDDINDVLFTGLGGRFKLNKRLSLNAEYYYVLPNQLAEDYYNSLAIGFDIETGGHVFQLHATNSRGMFEKAFITETNGKWKKGDIHFGFNITRIF